MRHGRYRTRAAVAIALGLVAVGLNHETSRADDPPQPGSRLARFFRFGNSSSDRAASSPTSTGAPPQLSAPPSTPEVSSTPTRIAPQPRHSHPATEADPLVTRLAIGKSDNGGQFGTFLAIYADGTILDSEGVHRIGQDALKPLLEALRQGELYRLRGHCGAPSTDYIDLAQVVIFDRSLGRLRATSFSYSGNPQGCDPSVKKLHAALDAIQAKVSGPPSVASAAAPIPPATAPAQPPAHQPPTPNPSAPVIELTPPR